MGLTSKFSIFILLCLLKSRVHKSQLTIKTTLVDFSNKQATPNNKPPKTKTKTNTKNMPTPNNKSTIQQYNKHKQPSG
jgi:hypothetical protein